MKYLIKVKTDGLIRNMFIDNAVLTGNKEELTLKLQDINYVNSLGIHESFFFNPLKLIPESEVDFPE